MNSMPTTIEPPRLPPPLRRELIVRALGTGGEFVVKDAAKSVYFHVGEQEHFLFTQLDGRRNGAEICEAFEQRFQETLAPDEFEEFVALALRRGLLEADPPANNEVATPGTQPAESKSTVAAPRKKVSLLHYRVPFFDPDRLFDLIEPRIRFVWTHAFLALSVASMLLAAWITVSQRQQWIATLPTTVNWETLVLLWFVIFLATMLHEFAHGLTCKHFGGEVHEIGFLLLFFMPCLYCNVSDAWLFTEKWKRIWVGLAGIFSDLLVWAVATIVWRITVPETSLNYFAWMLSSVCGGRCLFNFNPLVKMDGYYLLSDWAGVPNLWSRGRSRWFKTVGWLMWGGRRPKPDAKARFLLLYGISSWIFIGMLVSGSLLALLSLGSRVQPLGVWGGAVSVMIVAVIGKNMFSGIFAGEFNAMLKKRRGRALFWIGLLIGVPAAMFVIPFPERASGTFQVRPSTRIEVNALQAGFLRDIALEEGSRVSAGTQIARIEVPDLEVNLSTKMAEIRESEANLRKLHAGPRPEEVVAQRERVVRSAEWLTLGRASLERAKQTYKEELFRLDRQIALLNAEFEQRRQSLANAENLFEQEALSGEQLLLEKTGLEVKSLELEQARAEKRAREANGTGDDEAEVTRREMELANERSALALLEAGGRVEEIEAEKARLARLQEELRYLQGLQERAVLCSPVDGIITTPRMLEKNGQYMIQGAVVCVVEELSEVVAEIAIKEQDEHHVSEGQLVELRARAMPMRTFEASVARKAPSAVVAQGQTQGTVTVYCKLGQQDADLLSGMTGHARIYRGDKPLGMVVVDRVRKHLRTEFWWW